VEEEMEEQVEQQSLQQQYLQQQNLYVIYKSLCVIQIYIKDSIIS
jgi:hypothetical protein